MNIAIVTPSPIPFVIGGAEKLFWGLLNAINQLTPHNAELIKIPCNGNHFWGIIEGAYRFSQLNLDHFDLVITTKDPAWLISHPNHMVYMQHKCRGVYDLYHKTGQPVDFTPNHKELERLDNMLRTSPGRAMLPLFFQELFRLKDIQDRLAPLTFAFPGPLTRAIIHWLDKAALTPDQIRYWRAISRNVALREGYFPKNADMSAIDVKVIHHPTDLCGLHTGDYRHIFTASRLEKLKRVDLLITAFNSLPQRLRSSVEFHIAGTGGQQEALQKLASDAPQIHFLGYLNDPSLVEAYSSALFVPFVPYDEDYGLITLEAMLSGKAVLTTLDSGGVNELVTHNETGLCVEPRPGSIADAMKELIENREKTIEMGKRAKESVSDINWQNTVDALLDGVEPQVFNRKALAPSSMSPLRSQVATNVCTPKVVVVNTFQVQPPLSGGQKRIFHLYKELSSVADISYVSIGGFGPQNTSGNPSQSFITPNFEELIVPRNPRYHRHTVEVSTCLGVSADDIASIEGFKLLSSYEKAISSRIGHASLVILSHPYLFHAVRRCWSGPIWYEAHNVEYDIKSAILPDTEPARVYLKQVFEVEMRACNEAQLIIACSEQDAMRLVKLYGIGPETILVVPNGVDFSSVAPLSSDEKAALKRRLGIDMPVALFMGSLHKPNIEALPVIRSLSEACPDILFLVVGSVCEAESAPSGSNLLFLGRLEEEEKNIVLRSSDIGLNPVVSGSGTNLKLVEYAAAGLVCLTTKIGNRGLAFQNGIHLYEAELDEFASTLKKIVSQLDSDNTQQMTKMASQLVKEKYDWHVVSMPYKEKLVMLPTYNLNP